MKHSINKALNLYVKKYERKKGICRTCPYSNPYCQKCNKKKMKYEIKYPIIVAMIKNRHNFNGRDLANLHVVDMIIRYLNKVPYEERFNIFNKVMKHRSMMLLQIPYKETIKRHVTRRINWGLCPIDLIVCDNSRIYIDNENTMWEY